MPEVFTNQRTAAAKPRVVSAQMLASRQVAPFVKHAVGGEVHLAVHVVHPPGFHIHAAVVEAVVGGLLNHAEEKAHAPAGGEERLQSRLIQPARRLRHEVFQEVSVEGKLGKHEQVYCLRLRLGNHVQVLLDIARDIPEVRVDLRKADAE